MNGAPTTPTKQNDAQHSRPWRTASVDWRGRESAWKDGRVLLIDCIRQEHLSAGKVKMVAQEFRDVSGLEDFYKSERVNQSALRLIHVQNASWARDFLLEKFSISEGVALVGTDFAQWVKWEKPELKAGKPLLKGRTWKVKRDPWRKLRTTAFGLDYLKEYPAEQGHIRAYYGGATRKVDLKMMELNSYNNNDSPVHGFNVFAQRISVYVQKTDQTKPPKGMKNPYDQTERNATFQSRNSNGHAKNAKPQIPSLDSFDNGNTVIIFESSESNSAEDTLIQARNKIESRWRRLTFYLSPEETLTDEILASEGLNVVLEDIFKGLSISWVGFLNISESHINILEDKIYASPADETRAPELWMNSATWLKVEKLAYTHLDVAKAMLIQLPDMCNHNEKGQKWLDGIVEEYQKIANRVQEDLVKPTSSLNDLMYQSVSIRDARHGLQLTTSLWRLSWITFIFLPLTFLVGFFGMNVDALEKTHVKILWYFVAAILTMLLVLILWYSVKHSISAQRKTPYVRGVYEHFYHDLTEHHPELWTREGPQQESKPEGLFNNIRWRLVKFWFNSKNTLDRDTCYPEEEAAGSGLGTWSRLKRSLARRWTKTISQNYSNASDHTLSNADPERGIELQSNGIKHALSPTNLRSPLSQVGMLSPESGADRPSSSSASSGIMVEEWDADNEDDELVMTSGMTTIDKLMDTVGMYS